MASTIRASVEAVIPRTRKYIQTMTGYTIQEDHFFHSLMVHDSGKGLNFENRRRLALVGDKVLDMLIVESW